MSEMSDAYEKLKKDAAAKLADNLTRTFDGIAKLAMRASAEFSETQTDTNIVAKIQKAHSTITLIMDDAMRGLNDATTSVLAFTVAYVLEKEKRP
jgi:hypothetical protein